MAVNMDLVPVFQADGTFIDRNIPNALDENCGVYIEIRKTPVVVTKIQEAMGVTFFSGKQSKTVSFLAVSGKIIMRFDEKETVVIGDTDISGTESL